ncbi:MAG: hypothetical protein MAG715_00442 [Methanonatronarchaeales archaeon]|nr:hypothetical protein [Methanonatronarchaeales archaeon]
MKFSVKACSGRTGWDVEPEEPLDVDVKELAGFFEEVPIDTPHVIIVDLDEGEVSVYPDGSMFVKRAETREEAEASVDQVASRMEQLLGGPD